MDIFTKKFKVLIVEDQNQIINEIQRSLDKFSEFESIGVTNNEDDAFEMIKSKKPDILITDIDLDEGCGISLMRRIRADFSLRNTPPYIYAITGYRTDSKKHELKEYADDILYKKIPFNADKIFTSLIFSMISLNNFKSNNPDENTGKQERKIMDLIKSEINQFFYDPRRNEQRKYLSEMIYYLVINQDKTIKLKELRSHVANKYHLSNEKSLNTKLDRYLHELFEKTDKNILKAIDTAYDKKIPSLYNFLYASQARVISQLTVSHPIFQPNNCPHPIRHHLER